VKKNCRVGGKNRTFRYQRRGNRSSRPGGKIDKPPSPLRSIKWPLPHVGKKARIARGGRCRAFCARRKRARGKRSRFQQERGKGRRCRSASTRSATSALFSGKKGSPSRGAGQGGRGFVLSPTTKKREKRAREKVLCIGKGEKSRAGVAPSVTSKAFQMPERETCCRKGKILLHVWKRSGALKKGESEGRKEDLSTVMERKRRCKKKEPRALRRRYFRYS